MALRYPEEYRQCLIALSNGAPGIFRLSENRLWLGHDPMGRGGWIRRQAGSAFPAPLRVERLERDACL